MIIIPSNCDWVKSFFECRGLPTFSRHFIPAVNEFEKLHSSSDCQFQAKASSLSIKILSLTCTLIWSEDKPVDLKKDAQIASNSASASAVSVPIRSIFHWKNSRVLPFCEVFHSAKKAQKTTSVEGKQVHFVFGPPSLPAMGSIQV